MIAERAFSARQSLITLAGLVVASGVSAILFTFATSLHGGYTPALLTFGSFAAVFGLPTYLLRRNVGKDSLLSALVTGLLIGGCPMLLLGLPIIADPFQGFGGFISTVSGLGALGATGGGIFWLFVVYPGLFHPEQRQPVPSLARTILSCIAAVAMIGACFLQL